MIHLFLGYDPREDMAYQVAAHSAKRRCSLPMEITPLKLNTLRSVRKYWREVRRSGPQMIDAVDGLPFSTEFSFSRFLTPLIARNNGIEDPVIFADCDFLFLGDLARLLDHVDPTRAVSVVQHEYSPSTLLKMDGQAQTQYSRKLWSSLMVFNPYHADCQKLDLETVNTKPGSYLHSFEWTEDIGELPESWNWIPGHSPTTRRYTVEPPQAIHFTEGGPWFPAYKDVPYAPEWEAERRLVEREYFTWKHAVDLYR